MKITKNQLRKIIKEELEATLKEGKIEDNFWASLKNIPGLEVKPDGSSSQSEFELYKGEDGEIPASALAQNLLSNPMSSGSKVVDSALDHSWQDMSLDELGALIGQDTLKKIIDASRRHKRGDKHFKTYAQGLAKAIFRQQRDPASKTIDKIENKEGSWGAYFRRMDKH